MKKALLALYRGRGPVYYAALAILVANLVVGPLLSQDGVLQIRVVILVVAVLVVVMCVLLSLLVPRWLPAPPARVLQPPVQGRWLGMNSPASKVPSHGIRAYGQYSRWLRELPCARRLGEGINGRDRTGSGSHGGGRGSGDRRPGIHRRQPRHDPHRRRRLRHHRAPATTIDHRTGRRPSDCEHADWGCGNSGNSSEPHVHAQFMDRMPLWTAQGLPMVFAGITLDENAELVDALPKNEQHMTTSADALR